MEESYHNPILKRKPVSQTEAELLVWREISRDPTEFWKVPCDPYPTCGSQAGRESKSG